jgi:hypothetical protein
MNFHSTHASSIPPEEYNRDVDPCHINIRFLGGGASQNLLAYLILERYIATERPQYVVEIGSQKGSFSLYLANHASASEQFLFHTFELDKAGAWYKREDEGVGHWFEKLETISPYCRSFELDALSEEAQTVVRNNMEKYKTLIICDGGDKKREVLEYGHFLKRDDMIMAHDFGIEIFDRDIPTDILNLTYHEPWNTRFIENKTLFKTFIKL